MIISTVKSLPKATAEINITISWDEVKASYDSIFNEALKEVEVEGFRKGKVPRKLAEGKIDKQKVYEQVVKDVIPKAYAKALEEHKLASVTSPKVEVLKAKENEEWAIKVTIALKPVIKLDNYKEKIKVLKAGKTKIWTPGDDKTKKEDKPTIDELVDTLLGAAEIELSDLLIQDEANRLLADLVDQTQKLGLTVEQYIMAKGKTTEQLRAEYALQAAKNLKLEFIIREIADTEKITVSQEDIDKIIDKAEKPEEKERLKKESYYLAHLIRQQKTLEFLYNL